MPKIAVRKYTPRADGLRDIQRAEQICLQYEADGYDLSLRQIYYQFVANDWIPNNEKSYNRLKNLLSKARWGGLLDWNHIVDRTRSARAVDHFTGPGEAMREAAESFAIDTWADQPTRVEVWVEKEALAGVLDRVATRNDVPWFSCKGYFSTSAAWGAHQRLLGYMLDHKQPVVILYLGDHDPSGIDMGRAIRKDLHDLMSRFQSLNSVPMNALIEVRRIALTMEQITTHAPPPNFAKQTDSRYADYVREQGTTSSWELDALSPAVIDNLIQDEIDGERDADLWDAKLAEQNRHRELLTAAADRWDEVVDLLS